MYLQSEGVGGVVRGWDSCSACSNDEFDQDFAGRVCVCEFLILIPMTITGLTSTKR